MAEHAAPAANLTTDIRVQRNGFSTVRGKPAIPCKISALRFPWHVPNRGHTIPTPAPTLENRTFLPLAGQYFDEHKRFRVT
jgi:hypothetical protein